MEPIGKIRKLASAILFGLGALGTAVLLYGILTLPFWWKGEYFYSTSVVVIILEIFIEATLALSHKANSSYD